MSFIGSLGDSAASHRTVRASALASGLGSASGSGAFATAMGALAWVIAAAMIRPASSGSLTRPATRRSPSDVLSSVATRQSWLEASASGSGWLQLWAAAWLRLGAGLAPHWLVASASAASVGFGFGSGLGFSVGLGVTLASALTSGLGTGLASAWLGFDGIENPIGEQFHAVVHEEPRERIAPDEQRPNPSRAAS